MGVLTELAGDSLFLIAFFVMLASIILGMGIPTTTAYILAAAFAAPALIKMGIAPLVAHFYVFFFGVFANITPPVAVATFAAAALAQASIVTTAIKAMKIGLVALVIPYMFLFNPVLLGFGEPVDIVANFVIALIGVIIFSVGIVGWFKKKINFVARIGLTLSGLLIIYPDHKISLIGFSIIAIWFVSNFISTRITKRMDSPL